MTAVEIIQRSLVPIFMYGTMDGISQQERDKAAKLMRDANEFLTKAKEA